MAVVGLVHSMSLAHRSMPDRSRPQPLPRCGSDPARTCHIRCHRMGAARAGGVVSVVCQAGRKRRRRSEFVTTNTLENAIAAPATAGDSRPLMASGIASTL